MATATIRSSASNAATPTMPAGVVNGDLIIVFAYRSGNATPPTLPANWTNIVAASVNPSIRVAYRIKDASWSTMPAFTNAGRTHSIAITTGTYDSTNIFGATNTAGPTSTTTVTWPGTDINGDGFFDTQVDNDTSLVLRGAVKIRTDTAIAAPTGHTLRHVDGTQPCYFTMASNDGSDPFAATSNNTGRTDAHTIVQIEILGASSGTTIATGMATEVDTAFAQGRAVGLGVATSTNTALALTARHVVATDLTAETDTAFALTPLLLGATGLATETDTALALSQGSIIEATGLATETDTALALSALHIRAAGLSAETDTAVALTSFQLRSTGLATETDTALALTGQQLRATGLATETDTALALSQGGFSVSAATETDTAIARGLALGTGVATETGTALALAAVQIRATGLATETDTAVALQQGGFSVSAATETDQAFALGVAIPVSVAVEACIAIALAAAQAKATGLALEDDTALGLGFAVGLGRSDETDTAFFLGGAAPIPEGPFSAGGEVRSGGLGKGKTLRGVNYYEAKYAAEMALERIRKSNAAAVAIAVSVAEGEYE